MDKNVFITYLFHIVGILFCLFGIVKTISDGWLIPVIMFLIMFITSLSLYRFIIHRKEINKSKK